jgi:hypothetical protein
MLRGLSEMISFSTAVLTAIGILIEDSDKERGRLSFTG